MPSLPSSTSPINAAVAQPGPADEAANHLRLMTWNVRFDGKAQNQNKTWPIDTPPSKLNISLPNQTYPQSYTYGEYPWAYRRISLVSTILLQHPTILTMQEVLPNQLDELKQMLSPSYMGIGFGRDDGSGTKGEAAPVFFRTDLLELVPESEGGVGAEGFEHFWLSPTPEVAGSVGWDASQTRICTHLALRFRGANGSSGESQIIHLFSTHFDDGGVVARAESAKLIRARANQAYQKTLAFSNGQNEPLVVLMGDFNSPRVERAWRSIVAGNYGVPAAEAVCANSSDTSASSLPFLDTALSVPTRFRNPLSEPADYQQRQQSRGIRSVQSNLIQGRATKDKRQTAGSGLPFALLPNIVEPIATFTAWQRATGRSEKTDTIDFIYVLRSPAVEDSTPSSIQYPAEPESSSSPSARSISAADPLRRRSTEGAPQHTARTSDDSATTVKVRQAEESKWHIAAYGVLPSWSEGEGGVRMSDHRPVLARLIRR
ncbi:hypothetical protein V8E36_007117 [Tilletia maclaganii]